MALFGSYAEPQIIDVLPTTGSFNPLPMSRSLTPSDTPSSGSIDHRPIRIHTEPTSSGTTTQPQSGSFTEATSINECYFIDTLQASHSYIYSVGEQPSESRKITIGNKCLQNDIFVQVKLPGFLVVSGSQKGWTIRPNATETISISIDENSALNYTMRNQVTIEEDMQIIVQVLNVTGPVYVTT